MSEGNLKAQITEYSIGEVFKDGRDKYVVPLYQREYAWGKTEIERLLNDLFLAFEKGGNYYLGSFVVRRSSDDSTCFELVDGQQRLITLSMLFALYLNDNAAEKILSFQLRENADIFIDGCYNRSVLTDEGECAGVGAFRDAVRVIRNFYPETLDEDKKFLHKRGDSIDEVLSMVTGEGTFGQYLMKKVILFRVELPESTDVNSYFETLPSHSSIASPRRVS